MLLRCRLVWCTRAIISQSFKAASTACSEHFAGSEATCLVGDTRGDGMPYKGVDTKAYHLAVGEVSALNRLSKDRAQHPRKW